MQGIAGWAPGDLEPVACDLCGRRDLLDHFATRGDGLRVVICARCHLVFLDPRPTSEAIDRLYDRAYFSGGLEGVGYADRLSPGLATRIEYRRLTRERLRIARSAMTLPGSRLLDIGCATGEFAAAAAAAGALATGVDLSEAVVQTAAERYRRVRFLAGGIERLAAAGESFDVVCGFEVIEHVQSPSAFARDLRSVLRPGGVALLSTPNVAEARTVGLDRWLGFTTSFEHLYFFDPASLAAVVERAGLRLERWYGMGSGVSSPEPGRPTRRRPVRDALTRLHLLELARGIRSLSAPVSRYASGRSGHSLLAVVRG